MFDYITFLTDFGLQDDFVGVCRGVMKRIARDAEILDVTHGIAAQAVTQGALVLARSVPYLPPAVHLAVVDPGVGSGRRAVAIRTGEGRVFVGPDNGLLMVAADSLGVEASAKPHEPAATTSRRSRRPSRRATASRRSPRIWRQARTSTISATRSTRRASSASSSRSPPSPTES